MYNYGMQSPVMQSYNPYSYQGSVTQRVNNNIPRYDIIRVNCKPGKLQKQHLKNGLIGKPRQKSYMKIAMLSLYLIILLLQMQCLSQS